jgi:hypothetical protein
MIPAASSHHSQGSSPSSLPATNLTHREGRKLPVGRSALLAQKGQVKKKKKKEKYAVSRRAGGSRKKDQIKIKNKKQFPT